MPQIGIHGKKQHWVQDGPHKTLGIRVGKYDTVLPSAATFGPGSVLLAGVARMIIGVPKDEKVTAQKGKPPPKAPQSKREARVTRPSRAVPLGISVQVVRCVGPLIKVSRSG